ncbi:MAG: phosphorylase family protein [Desulfobaccales bacterium]
MISTSPDPGGITTSRTCRTLIVAALIQEVQPFLRRVQARPRRDLGLPAWDWEPEAAVVALSGMGPAAARRATETLISLCRPQLLVSMGFGGALVPGLAVGDVVLGETFWHYNPGTRKLTAGARPPAPRPLMQLSQALKTAGLTTVNASLVTTTRIIPKKDQGEPLTALPHPVLDLETGVLAEVAAAHNLPFLSLRAITDTAGEEIPEFLRNAGDKDATVGVGAALKWLAQDFRRTQDLLRLWRSSRRAAQALSEALIILWPHLSNH